MSHRVPILLLPALSALAVVACGSSPTGSVDTGRSTSSVTTSSSESSVGSVAPPLPLEGTGVRGRVTAGPTCPVERPGQPCPPNPVHGRVDALDPAGRTVADVMIDDVGRYAISVPPGQYTLHVVTDGPFPRCPDTAVSVTGISPVTGDIDCDTGIR